MGDTLQPCVLMNSGWRRLRLSTMQRHKKPASTCYKLVVLTVFVPIWDCFIPRNSSMVLLSDCQLYVASYLHCSTETNLLLGRIVTVLRTQMRPIVTDRVARSVCPFVCHSSEPCKCGWTDLDAIWVENSGGPKKPCATWGSTPILKGGERQPIVKYRDTLWWTVQKWLNWSRCYLVMDSGGPKKACIRWGSRSPCKGVCF